MDQVGAAYTLQWGVSMRAALRGTLLLGAGDLVSSHRTGVLTSAAGDEQVGSLYYTGVGEGVLM